MLALLLTIAAAPAELPVHPMPVAVEQSGEPSDEQICDSFNALAAEVNKELPKMTDAVTRTDGIAVVCALKLFTTSKYILLTSAEMKDGWQATKQAQFDKLNCVDQPRTRKLIDRGWVIEAIFSLRSGERVAMRAHCS